MQKEDKSSWQISTSFYLQTLSLNPIYKEFDNALFFADADAIFVACQGKIFENNSFLNRSFNSWLGLV